MEESTRRPGLQAGKRLGWPGIPAVCIFFTIHPPALKGRVIEGWAGRNREERDFLFTVQPPMKQLSELSLFAPGQSQELGVSSRSLTWAPGAQALGPASSAFPEFWSRELVAASGGGFCRVGSEMRQPGHEAGLQQRIGSSKE